MTTCISLDDETKKRLEEMKKRDLNFNLSQYVRECVMKDFPMENKTLADIQREKEEYRHKIEQHNFTMAKLDEEVIELRLKTEQEKKEREMFKNREEQKIAQRRQTFLEFAQSWYGINDEEVTSLIDEFSRGNMSLNIFMEEKGYTRKNEQRNE